MTNVQVVTAAPPLAEKETTVNEAPVMKAASFVYQTRWPWRDRLPDVAPVTKGDLPSKMIHIIDPFSACLACYTAERKPRRATNPGGPPVSSDFDPLHRTGRLPASCNWQLAHEPESI